MGFRAPARRQVTIRYAGDLTGLEVTVRSAGAAQVKAAAKLLGLSDDPGITPEDAEIITGLFEAFGRSLVSWNLESPEAGEPIPATLESLDELDDAFVLDMIMPWLATVTGGGASVVVAAGRSELPDDERPGSDADLAASLEIEPLGSQ